MPISDLTTLKRGSPRCSPETRLFLLIVLALLVFVPGPASAQSSPAPSTVGRPDPADLRLLGEVLAKPAVRDWLKDQAADPAPPATAVTEPASVTQSLGRGLDAARLRLRLLATAIPDLPVQLVIVRETLMAEIRAHGLLTFLGPIVLFGLLGTLAEQVFWRATAGLRRGTIRLPVDTPEQRLAAAGHRALYALAVVAVFAAGSVGAFLALDWPPLLQEIVLTYLIVFLAVRLTLVAGRVVLAPGAERFRLLPMATASARYWFVWSAVLVGAFYFAKGTFRLVPVLGADPTARTLVGIALSFVVLLLALTAIWLRPDQDGRTRRRLNDPATWIVSLWLVGVWLTAFTGETAPFDIGLVLLLLAIATLALRRAVDHLLRSSEETPEARTRPTAVVAIERSLRAAIVLIAALVIAHSAGFDLTALAATDTTITRIARGILNVLVIGLVADVAWQVSRAWIDHRVSAVSLASAAGTDEDQRHRQRVRTLLPILRNLLLIVLLGVAGLMALASLGIEVGPLVAGAGVVGIAVGFGAQTLVKDVISGLFFLFDDAFRVGEYIESGRIKGTVEAFSLRSIKLRHHRGPLHTVPFGALSAITNYSRDWVIDKITLGLAYDTDLDEVKRVVKDVGRELQEDPEFAPYILEPLKMQGVNAFGDFAIQVQLKMMTKPGEQQYTIRHRAHALIKQAFAAENIQFAYPTVAIAGTGSAAATAAAQVGLQHAAATSQRPDETRP